MLYRALALFLVFICCRAGVLCAENLPELFRQRSTSCLAISFKHSGYDGESKIFLRGTFWSSDGLAIFCYSDIPMRMRFADIRDFRVFFKGGDELGLKARFLGFDEISGLGFLKLDNPAKELFPVGDLPRREKLNVADDVWGAALAEASNCHVAEFYSSKVSISFDGVNRRHILCSGVSRMGEPVFDKSGAFAGITADSSARTVLVSQGGDTEKIPLEMYDIPNIVLSAESVAAAVRRAPKSPEESKSCWIGVYNVGIMDRGAARLMGLGDSAALTIGDVLKNSPAERAGLKQGDIVLEVDGKNIPNSPMAQQTLDAFSAAIDSKRIGEPLRLKIFDGAEKKDVEVFVGPRPKTYRQCKAKYYKNLGFAVREMLMDDSERLGAMDASPKGCVVDYVGPELSKREGAASSTLADGDLIREINSQHVGSFEEAVKLIGKLGAGARQLVILAEAPEGTKLVKINVKK